MPFAITKSCCADASCVSVCPVACIHPTPGEPGFGTSEILHIDPATCIDCGACADACPVDAVYPVDRLSPADQVYAEINASYYLGGAPEPVVATTGSRHVLRGGATRIGATRSGHESGPDAPSHVSAPPTGHVAVVGAGAAGSYTLKELLARTDTHLTVIDAAHTPGGLIRSGVAPDHPATKRIQRSFDVALQHHRVRLLGGVELGSDVSLADLRERFDAVFVATGAAQPRSLGVPGEDHARVVAARDVTAWAGGVPGAATPPLDERCERVVIVGTGNVALDVVRLLTLPPQALAGTDVADRALAVLREARVREVVVLGRGPAAGAAFTQAEFRALEQVSGLHVEVIDADDACPPQLRQRPAAAPNLRSPAENNRAPRVTFLFGTRVEAVDEDDETARGGVKTHLARTEGSLTLAADLVVTSLGQSVSPLEGLPFDASRGAFTHDGGRAAGLPGVYVVGWAKRGAVGGIGANRQCAQESVAAYLADAPGLARPSGSAASLPRDLARRGVRITDAGGARAIDRHERAAGAAQGRPRVKLTELEHLLRASAVRRRP